MGDKSFLSWPFFETRHRDLESKVAGFAKTVVPGLIDGHAHVDREALRSVYPSLGRVRSIREIKERIDVDPHLSGSALLRYRRAALVVQ